ncbi:hypothetical protein MRS44_009625 [Fusarium solani]|uniref:uncharacterized protein n=1 Tax=Fusarium solani TaxID=169388 RepID=UPI0032C40989|nr:hypothetical protein MRS44_009625 [Fusarium solani]
MSYQTKPCFIGSFKGWDNEALKHPVMQYLNTLNTDFCETKVAHPEPHTKWFTQEFELQTQTGQVLRGEEAWKRMIHTTRFYDKFSMEPISAFIQGTEDGYDGMVYGNMYTNFVEPGEKKHSDNKGIEWELRIPRAYRLTFLKDSSGPHGLKISNLVIVGDTLGTMAAAVRKGMVSQENAFSF